MVTQKAISAKVDEELLQELDEYLAQHIRLKRNAAINLALRMWLQARRAKEQDKTYERQGNEPSPLVLKFIRDNLTYRAKLYLDLIYYH